MKKITLLLLFTLSLATLQAQRKENSATHDEGVVINGVRWATRNVDVPGTFTENVEDAGMLFQWNRRKGWNATDRNVEDWNALDVPERDFIPNVSVWWRSGGDENPCPPGWRVPSDRQLERLHNAGSEWVTQNGVYGRLFGTAPYQIFLPVAGYRHYDNGMLLFENIQGRYWSDTPVRQSITTAWNLTFNRENSHIDASDRGVAQSVRCVFIEESPPREMVSPVLSFGTAHTTPTGRLGGYFSSFTGLNASVGIQSSFGGYIGLQADWGSMRLDRPLLRSETGHSHGFEQGHRFEYFAFMFIMGCRFTLLGDWFHVMPFWGLGVTQLGSIDSDDREAFIFTDSFTMGAGLRVQVLPLAQLPGLRFDIGYNMPTRMNYVRGRFFYLRANVVWEMFR